MAVEIRVAGTGDLDALTAIMATAFRNDPAWGEYSFPGSRERLDTASAFWRAYLGAMLRHRWSFLTAGQEPAGVWVAAGGLNQSGARRKAAGGRSSGWAIHSRADASSPVLALTVARATSSRSSRSAAPSACSVSPSPQTSQGPTSSMLSAAMSRMS